jgi:hypothetical protein
MNYRSSIERRVSNEDVLRQGIMEDLVHNAGYHDSDKDIVGDIIRNKLWQIK